MCELGEELGSVSYTDRHGRPKTVRYWRMEVCDGEFRPNREVSELRWLPPDQAADQLRRFGGYVHPGGGTVGGAVDDRRPGIEVAQQDH